MEQDSVIRNLSRRIAQLEQAAVANSVSVIDGRFKRAEGVITAGDVYIIKATANRLVDTTDTEADENPVVVALNSTSAAHEWARCTNTGFAWVNFESGHDATPCDYVITSGWEGKARGQATRSSSSFGRLIQWDSSNLRGYVLLGREGGIGNLVYSIQDSSPTPTAAKFNVWEDDDDGHIYLYSHTTAQWVKVTGYIS